MSETISATLSKVITVLNVFGKIVEHPSSLALKGTRDMWNGLDPTFHNRKPTKRMSLILAYFPNTKPATANCIHCKRFSK
jgi:hypothetical protein